MVTLENEGYEWQFFIGERAFTDKTYPKDIDTTSLAHIILPTSSSEKELAMETILSYRTRDGLPMVTHLFLYPPLEPSTIDSDCA